MPWVAGGGKASERVWRTAFGALVFAGPLLVGGVHVPVNASLAAVACGLAGAYFFIRRRDDVALTTPALLLLFLVAWVLLQLVPLPMAALAWVSPKGWDVVSLDAERVAAPLSLDPPATAHEAIKLVLYFWAAVLAAQWFRGERRSAQLLRWMVAAGVAVLGLGIAHSLAGVDRSLGAFGRPTGGLISTFVNPNHLAAFLGLTSILALGLGIRARPRERWLFLGASSALALGTFLTLSRGGMLALTASVAFFGVTVLLGRRVGARQVGGVSPVLIVQGVFAVTLLLAAYLAYGQVVLELWTLSDERAYAKMDIWQPVPAILRDFWGVGLGRGAFASVYPHYMPAGSRVTFSHLENEWLQLVVDVGLLAGAVALGVSGWIVWRFARAASSSHTMAALTTVLVFLGMENMGDFSLTTTGVGFYAVMAITVGYARLSDGLTWRVRGAWLAAGSAACLGAVLGLGWYAHVHRLAADEKRVREQVVRHGLDSRALAEVVRHHPADYFLPTLVAEAALAKGEPKPALRWANRAMYLAPSNYRGHLLAARALWRLGARSQAWLEYRLTLNHNPALLGPVASEVFGKGGAAAVTRLVNDDIDRTLGLSSFLIGRGEAAVALELLEPMGNANEYAVRAARVRALLALKRLEEADAQSQALLAQHPGVPDSYLLRSYALRAQKQWEESVAVLEQGVAELGRARLGLLSPLASAYLQLRDGPRLAAVARRLLEESGAPHHQAEAHAFLAQAYMIESRPAMAVRHFERARDINPAALSHRLNIASAREGMADLEGARGELLRAKRELGPVPAIEQRIHALERRLDDKNASALQRLLPH